MTLCLTFGGDLCILSSYTLLCFGQQGTRVPVSLHPPHHLRLSVSFIIAVQGAVQRCLMVLICLSLMANDVEPFHALTGPVCMSSLQKCLFKSLASLKISLLSYYWFVRVLYVLWVQVSKDQPFNPSACFSSRLHVSASFQELQTSVLIVSVPFCCSVVLSHQRRDLI